MELSKIEILEKIVKFNTLINQSIDFDELLRIILKETEKMFRVEGTSLLLDNKQKGELSFYIVTGPNKLDLSAIKMKEGEGVCGYVFSSGKPLIENHPENSPFFASKVDDETSFKTRNLLCVPLISNNESFGVIELVNKIGRDFAESDLQLLEAIASQVAITLERARLIEEKIAAEKMAAIGEMVAGLAHYIKNILNGLQGGEFILNKNRKKGKIEGIQTGWNIVEKNVKKISALVMDMLHYSKDRVPEYKFSNINQVLVDIFDLNKKKAEDKGVKLLLELENEIPEVKIDPDGIFRCILNLVNNAIDALENSDNGVIKLITRIINQNEFEIEVKDNGCGMSAEQLQKLFTKFFSTKGTKGTGIGLPVTKKIIDEHHGDIRVKSEVNIGTSFIINLPVNFTGDLKNKN